MSAPIFGLPVPARLLVQAQPALTRSANRPPHLRLFPTLIPARSSPPRKGISRNHWHKRRATGGKRKPLRKKRKFELGRPAANTKVGGLVPSLVGSPSPFISIRDVFMRVICKRVCLPHRTVDDNYLTLLADSTFSPIPVPAWLPILIVSFPRRSAENESTWCEHVAETPSTVPSVLTTVTFPGPRNVSLYASLLQAAHLSI